MMKSSTADFARKQFLPCILLVILTSLIWLGWPQLANAPSATSRFYLTAALYLSWLLKLILIDLAPIVRTTPQHPALQKHLNLLEGRLNGVLRFLRKTPLVLQGVRSHFGVLPWHLLIGPEGAGKTALLAHSGMRFVLSKKFTPETLQALPPSTTSDWWVTRDLVLVDMPGSWFGASNQPPALWQGFLDLLRKKQVHSKLASTVIALNLPELMQASHIKTWEQTVSTLRKQIEHLRNTLGHQLPFYLIITKCDLLPGFSAFFRDSSREELSSAWGITLPHRQPDEKLQDLVCQRFNALVKQLNQQLVLRLHQERNPLARPLIKDFPLEVEKLRDQILQLLTMTAPDLPLRGIWLTSATQSAESDAAREIQGMTASLSRQTPALTTPPSVPARPYFIRQMIQHGLPGGSGKRSAGHARQTALRRMAYTLSGGLLVAAALLFGRDFAEGTRGLHQLEIAMQQYQTLQQQSTPLLPPLSETLTLLAALQPSQDNIEISSFSLQDLSQRLLNFYSGKAHLDAANLYRDALKTILLPALSQPLDTWLKKIKNDTPPAQLYQVLSARLMLAGNLPLQADTVIQALRTTGSVTNDKKTLARLLLQLELTAQNQFSMTLKPSLLESARHQLTRLPVYQLGMLLLENNVQGAEDNTDSRIPVLFTKTKFSDIMSQGISQAATEALHGNAILGTLSNSTHRSDASAVAQLRNRYLENYTRFWVQTLHHLATEHPRDLFATDTIITDLANGTSPLWQQLQTINDNTDFVPVNRMNPALQAIHTLFVEDPNSHQGQTHHNNQALTWLHQQLAVILTAEDSQQAAFQLVMQCIRNPENNPFMTLYQISKQNPEPMKTWLRRLAEISWHQVVKTSGVPMVQTSLVAAFQRVKAPEPVKKHLSETKSASVNPQLVGVFPPVLQKKISLTDNLQS